MAARRANRPELSLNGFTFKHNGKTFPIPAYDPAKRDDDEPVEGAWVGSPARWVPMPTTQIAIRALKREDRDALRTEQYLADVGNAVRTLLAHLTTEADAPTVTALDEIIQQDSHKQFWEIYRGWVAASGEQEPESEQGNGSGSQES